MGYKFKMPSEEELKTMAEELETFFDERTKFIEETVKAKGEDILRRIISHLEKEGFLGDEGMSYTPEDYPVTLEEYTALFDSMMDYADENYYVDDDNFFDHKSVFYTYDDKLIELFIMSGQGTVTSFSSGENTQIKFEGSNMKKAIDFEDFKRDVINKS